MTTSKPNGRPPKKTSVAAIERQQRAAEILNMRLQGFRLAEIGAALSPPVSKQRVFQLLVRALRDMVLVPLKEARELESLRLDEALVGIYDRAVAGDIACIDRALAIADRRARLLNLYPQRPVAAAAFGGEVFDPDKVKVVVVAPGETENPMRQKIPVSANFSLSEFQSHEVLTVL